MDLWHKFDVFQYRARIGDRSACGSRACVAPAAEKEVVGTVEFPPAPGMGSIIGDETASRELAPAPAVSYPNGRYATFEEVAGTACL